MGSDARAVRWPSARASAIAAIGACALLAGLLRLPFLHAGIGMDEGGYAYVALRWARGAPLYHGAWVDRPQGLLLAYRLLLDISHSAWVIRLGALLVAVAATVLLGVAGWLARSPAAGVAAAAIFAVVSVGPHIEGFTFNGELAGVLPSVASVACAFAWRRSGRGAWLIAAGLLGGVAPLMKQSAFDGLVASIAVVACVPAAPRQRMWRAAGLLGCASLPLVASAIQGWLSGWHAYWFAVVEYRLLSRSGGAVSLGWRLHALGATLPAAQADLFAVSVVALVGVLVCLRRPRLWPPLVWLAAAAVAVNIGGRYWPHYYVQLVAPLALLAGIGATAVQGAARRVALVGVALAPVAFTLAQLSALSPTAFAHQVAYDFRSTNDEAIADYVACVSRPRDTIYALTSEADLYFLAGRLSPYRYLWAPEIYQIPGALEGLRRTLASPHGPAVVVVYARPRTVDRRGIVAGILARDYVPVWRAPATRRLVLVARRARADLARTAFCARGRGLQPRA